MKPVPLFGSGVRSISDIVSRQRRLNCLYDVRQDQDRAGVFIIGTPGHYIWITLPDAPIRGFHEVAGVLYVVAGTNLYKVTAGGSYTNLGAIPTAAQVVCMADNSAQLLIVDGVSGYVLTLATGVITTIVDANFPNGASWCAFLNSRFIVNVPNTREFRVCQTLDGITWTPLVFATKENSSDLIVAVSVLNGTLILYGVKSTEFWQDVGTTPLPYQRVNSSTQAWGLVAPYSRIPVNNTEIFLAVDPNGAVRVVKWSGYAPEPVSTSDEDDLIAKLSVYQDAVALAYTFMGHVIYQLTFPTANRTLAFDTKTGVWHEAQTGTSALARHAGNLGVSFNAKNYISDSTTGNIYQIDPTTYTDNGTQIIREVCTRHLRAEGNVFTLSELLLDMETGVGNSDSPNPTITIQISRDGGRTFGPQKQKSMGAVGQYLSRVRFNRLGSGTDIVVKIKCSDKVKFVLGSGSATLEMGVA